ELAGPIRELRARIEAERSAREAADDALLAASARLRVDDSDWDQALQLVSARAYELAGKKADAEPYATLFGRVDAKRARSFGAAKAQVVGLAVVKDGRRLDEAEALSETLDQLEAATAKLSASKATYDEADDALFLPRQAKKKLIGKLNEAIAVAEAGILTAFPGRGDLVNAILTPWFERRTRPKAGSEPDDDAPDTPELEDTDVGGDT
ncbi:MAG TPA: hypothetical protein PK095_13555, partial [Myxococcota bacterium]|nr:hypothetical protein [Myxococcota bacterium]